MANKSGHRIEITASVAQELHDEAKRIIYEKPDVTEEQYCDICGCTQKAPYFCEECDRYLCVFHAHEKPINIGVIVVCSEHLTALEMNGVDYRARGK